MSDEALREAERAFAQDPSAESALELLQRSQRGGEVAPQALRHLLDDAVWAGLKDPSREQVAAAVEQTLDGRATFDGLETFAMGGQERRIARFSAGDRSLALVLGGPATLGYAAESFRPTPAQAEEWAETEEEYEIALAEHLRRCLSPPREVVVEPFLLETTQDYLRQDKQAKVEAALAAEGYRLPTTDEWEYASAAGTRTLFRWGDDCPTDRYPSSGERPPWGGPNAFGITFGTDPYRSDLCSDGARGGDGGTAICGGVGFVFAWLTLSSWFQEEGGLSFDAIGSDYYRLRRVLPLDLG